MPLTQALERQVDLSSKPASLQSKFLDSKSYTARPCLKKKKKKDFKASKNNLGNEMHGKFTSGNNEKQ